MSDLGFFAAFFVGILVLAIVAGGSGNGIFSDTSTSTPPRHETVLTSPETARSSNTTSGNTSQSATPKLTSAQVEEKVAAIYRDLDRLKEDLRKAKLHTPESPYHAMVSLQTGNVYDTNPDREYLTLRAESANASGIDISKWYLRSYVTETTADIPDGDRTLLSWRRPVPSPIVLLPGESAYLVTGFSPINTSFKENMCTGYLNDEEHFYPSLYEQCPYPKDELKRFGNKIELDNDRCYTFIESLSSCTEPAEERYTRSSVGGACSVFIANTFNYADCVRLHRYDPYFDRNGYWHIYLGEHDELWRPQREIIQLIDEQDRVVSVIEY